MTQVVPYFNKWIVCVTFKKLKAIKKDKGHLLHIEQLWFRTLSFSKKSKTWWWGTKVMSILWEEREVMRSVIAGVN